jgi:hypothetical protein
MINLFTQTGNLLPKGIDLFEPASEGENKGKNDKEQ